MKSIHDMIGCIDDDELLALWNSQPEVLEGLFDNGHSKEAVVEAIAVRARESLAEASGLFFPPKIDPSLPEIILLHGVTDCHLADVNGHRNRIWLDYLELIKGQYARCLTLQPDGLSDQPNVQLETDGPVIKKYKKALDGWRQRGFQSHVFCYDWRKSVFVAADKLNTFLRGLGTVQAGRKVILVCHSMGGLVASAYAARHQNWDAVVEHCVFVGSPLGGAYSAAVAILGKSPSFEKMDRLSIFESLEDLQRMAASFPGLVDLLPNPELFPEAAEFYSTQGWPGAVKPRQEWLDHSLDVKRTVWASPILAKSTHLVSLDFPTVAEMPWNDDRTDRVPNVMNREGDGAVLTRSSLVPGLNAFKIHGEHSMLCVEQTVILAVEAIAKGQSPNLTPISVTDLTNKKFVESTGGAGLIARAMPTESPLTEHVSEALIKRFASDGTSGAMLQLTGNTGRHSFDRMSLRSVPFSWQNALSLAIASEFAYQKNTLVLETTAKSDWGFEGCQLFNVKETQGFIAWDDKVVLLSFRGTEKNFADWLGNLSVAAQDTPYGRIHSGFANAFQQAKSTVDSILNRIQAKQKQLWITGHSLGGALAVIAGAAYQRDHSIAGVYTYGQPKLAVSGITDIYHSKLDGRYNRFVNHEDVVPQVPPGYEHFGKLTWFNRHGQTGNGSAAGLTSLVASSAEPQPAEMSKVQFDEMQARLKLLSEPALPGALRLPPTEARMESQALFGYSVKEHSIRDAYVPVLAKQF